MGRFNFCQDTRGTHVELPPAAQASIGLQPGSDRHDHRHHRGCDHHQELAAVVGRKIAKIIFYLVLGIIFVWLITISQQPIPAESTPTPIEVPVQ